MPSADLLPPTPGELDARLTQYPSWRPGQREMAINCYLSEKRFNYAAMPVGTGKGLAYMTAYLLNGGRGAVLTHSKGLQDQLKSDFACLGMVDVRGRSNYKCTYYSNAATPVTCEDAAGACKLREHCTYNKKVATARASSLMVTNFSAWIYQIMFSKQGGFGQFDFLVIDEAHGVFENVCKALSVTLYRSDIHSILRTNTPATPTMSEWVKFAQHFMPATAVQMQAEEERSKFSTIPPTIAAMEHLKRLRRIYQVLDVLALAKPADWITYPAHGKAAGFVFEPIWPAPATVERVLFNSIPKVLLTSATLTPKVGSFLGTAQQDMEFQSYPYAFDPRRSPIYTIPCASMAYRNKEMGAIMSIGACKQIIAPRQDRKGIIHSVSYERKDFLTNNLNDQFNIISHTSGHTAEAVEMFGQAGPGAVIISPSISTGYNFPMSASEYQIIPKVPFPDSRGSAIKARQSVDKEYGPYLMATELSQMCGRIMRQPNDHGETFVIDDDLQKFVLRTYGRLFPDYFHTLIVRCNSPTPPTPPPPLDEIMGAALEDHKPEWVDESADFELVDEEPEED